MHCFRPDPSGAPGERPKLALELREPSAYLGIEVNGEKDAHQSIRRNAKTQRRKDAKKKYKGDGETGGIRR